VCNAAIGISFLLLEPDTARLAKALSLVLDGLEVYLDTAFEEDGGSTEGIGYWQYGLQNVICFSEMLRQRTQGQIDILSSVDKLKHVALYPLKVLLSPGRFASFSDSSEQTSFYPGLITRLAERTGRPEIGVLLAGPGARTGPVGLNLALRTMLWWDGTQPEPAPVGDAYLPNAGVVRLSAETIEGTPIVVAFKAGHNAENHNQNDVGTFIVHADGETFLCDPGRGLYSRQYFGPQRYENIFANSYGHSVPVIDGQLQAAGREFAGRILAFEPDAQPKHVLAEIDGAYPVDALQHMQRAIQLNAAGKAGTIKLVDTFSFAGEPSSLQETFVTWLEATVEGNTARLYGAKQDLVLTIEFPSGATFDVESLDKASKANQLPAVLQRLTVDLPAQTNVEIAIRMELEPKADRG
jgi:hypothetical protein